MYVFVRVQTLRRHRDTLPPHVWQIWKRKGKEERRRRRGGPEQGRDDRQGHHLSQQQQQEGEEWSPTHQPSLHSGEHDQQTQDNRSPSNQSPPEVRVVDAYAEPELVRATDENDNSSSLDTHTLSTRQIEHHQQDKIRNLNERAFDHHTNSSNKSGNYSPTNRKTISSPPPPPPLHTNMWDGMHKNSLSDLSRVSLSNDSPLPRRTNGNGASPKRVHDEKLYKEENDSSTPSPTTKKEANYPVSNQIVTHGDSNHALSRAVRASFQQPGSRTNTTEKKSKRSKSVTRGKGIKGPPEVDSYSQGGTTRMSNSLRDVDLSFKDAPQGGFHGAEAILQRRSSSHRDKLHSLQTESDYQHHTVSSPRSNSPNCKKSVSPPSESKKFRSREEMTQFQSNYETNTNVAHVNPSWNQAKAARSGKQAYPVAPGATAGIAYQKSNARPPPVLPPGDSGYDDGKKFAKEGKASPSSEEKSVGSPKSQKSSHHTNNIIKRNIQLVDSGAYRQARMGSHEEKDTKSSDSVGSPPNRRRGSVASLPEEHVAAAANRLYSASTSATKSRNETRKRDARRRASVDKDEVGRASWMVDMVTEIERNVDVEDDGDSERRKSVDTTSTSHRSISGRSVITGVSRKEGDEGKPRVPRHRRSSRANVPVEEVEEVYSSEYLSSLARVARSIRAGFSDGPGHVPVEKTSSPTSSGRAALNFQQRSPMLQGVRLSMHGRVLLNHLGSTVRKTRSVYEQLKSETQNSLGKHQKQLDSLRRLVSDRVMYSRNSSNNDDWFGITGGDTSVVSAHSLESNMVRSMSPRQLNLTTWAILADNPFYSSSRRYEHFALETTNKSVVCHLDGYSRQTVVDRTIHISADDKWKEDCGSHLANEVIQSGKAVFIMCGPRKSDKLKCLIGRGNQKCGSSLFSQSLHFLLNRIDQSMEMRMNSISISNQGIFDLLHPDFASTSSPRKSKGGGPPKIELLDERGFVRLQAATSVRLTSSEDVDILERVMYRRLKPISEDSDDCWKTIFDLANRHSHTVFVIDVLSTQSGKHKIVYRLCFVIFADGVRTDTALLSNLMRASYFSQPEESTALTKVENSQKWAQQERVAVIRALEAWKNSTDKQGKNGVVSRASLVCRVLGTILQSRRTSLTVGCVLPYDEIVEDYMSLEHAKDRLVEGADTSDIDFELRFVEDLNNIRPN